MSGPQPLEQDDWHHPTEWNGARNKDREEDDTERPMKIVLTIMPLCSSASGSLPFVNSTQRQFIRQQG
jgi:hypothetical protein